MGSDNHDTLNHAKNEYDQHKGTFPLAYFAGTFSGRKDDQIEQFSNIVVIDIDGKEQLDRLSFKDRRDVLKREIFNHPSVVATFISPSGYGIKALVLVDEPDTHTPTGLMTYYRRAYTAITEEWEPYYGILIDKQCGNVGRGHYLAHDPEVLVKDGEILPFRIPDIIEPHGKLTETTAHHAPPASSETRQSHRASQGDRKAPDRDRQIVEQIYDQCFHRNISLTGTYKEWITVGLALKRIFDDEQGLVMFDRFSRLDACYEQEKVRSKWEELHQEHNGRSITLASLIWLSKQKGITVFDDLTPSDRFECWFQSIYQVKLNRLDHAVYWRPTGTDQQFSRFSWDYNIASIGRDAEKELGIPISDRVVNRIIRDIAYKHQFNPIQEYLESLTWDGRDRLDDLFGSVVTDNDDLFREQFTKWFVNMIPTALGLDANDKVIVLQGDQGTGKTYFLENLLPRYREFTLTETTIKFNPEDKDDLHKAITRMIVVFDEMTSYSRSNLQALKSFISAREFTLRAPYGKDYIVCRKIASCCGCVNEDKFLRDATGDRRYLVFRCISRDTARFDSIDKEQLLAQAVAMYREGFDYHLSMEEYQEIIGRNRRNFTAKTTDEVMLEENLYPSDVERMTQTEIMEAFRERHGYKFMAQPSTLGLYLKNMGIGSKRVKAGKKLVTYYSCTVNPTVSEDLAMKLQMEFPDALF